MTSDLDDSAQETFFLTRKYKTTTSSESRTYAYVNFGFSYSQRLYIAGIPNQRVSGNVFYNGNRTITLLQGLAANGNASAGNMIAIGGGINTNSATLVFESIIGGFIDFTLYFYG